MLNRINCKNFISKLLIIAFLCFIFLLKIQLAWSQNNKPRAIVIGLNSSSSPEISEQILLQILREKLENNFDLSSQSDFEKLLRKKSLSYADHKCRKLKCVLDVHANFPRTYLFLLKSPKSGNRITLEMTGENHKWIVKHELCSNCEFTRKERVKNLALFFVQGYFTSTIPMTVINSTKLQKSTSSNIPKNVSRTKQFTYSDHLLRLKETINKKEPRLPLEEFKFKLAQKQYNKLIGNKIKRDLMFFRHQNRQQNQENLTAQLRLQINKSGEIVDRLLIKNSGSSIFDKIVLDTVDLLELPPPMELLIREPPYVVTILIQP